MSYRVLADLVLVLHLAFILFVLCGGLLALRWRWAPLVHLPAALWGVIVEVSGGLCPLTPLENALRRAAGASGYSGGFIEHYLLPLIYPEALSHPLQLLLAGVVVITNVAVYRVVWRRRSRARGRLAPRRGNGGRPEERGTLTSGPKPDAGAPGDLPSGSDAHQDRFGRPDGC